MRRVTCAPSAGRHRSSAARYARYRTDDFEHPWLPLRVLHDFLTNNRDLLIYRCRLMADARLSPISTLPDLTHGIPIFLDQVIETLVIEQTAESDRSRLLSGSSRGGSGSEIGDIATLHGRDLLNRGFTLEQVVRAYGDVCQAVTNLAYENDALISVEEFRTLNRCLDNAIAGAVTEYSLQKTAAATEDNFRNMSSKLGPLAHELRNYLHAAMYAVKAIKAGNVGISGATGGVLERSLIGMRSLIDRSLAEIRVTSGLPARAEAVRLAEFAGDIEAAASLDPRARTLKFTVLPIPEDATVYADPDMLTVAVSNLVQNAFKFTQRGTEVILHAHTAGERVLIEVADHCGGLPPGPIDALLKPFSQSGDDRSGLGLGLDICRRGVEANGGTLSIRNAPGVGCAFIIDLPRHPPRVTTP